MSTLRSTRRSNQPPRTNLEDRAFMPVVQAPSLTTCFNSQVVQLPRRTIKSRGRNHAILTKQKTWASSRQRWSSLSLSCPASVSKRSSWASRALKCSSWRGNLWSCTMSLASTDCMTWYGQIYHYHSLRSRWTRGQRRLDQPPSGRTRSNRLSLKVLMIHKGKLASSGDQLQKTARSSTFFRQTRLKAQRQFQPGSMPSKTVRALAVWCWGYFCIGQVLECSSTSL